MSLPPSDAPKACIAVLRLHSLNDCSLSQQLEDVPIHNTYAIIGKERIVTTEAKFADNETVNEQEFNEALLALDKSTSDGDTKES
ncbi:hypothetical protein E2P81_ATG12055 [Venturia nashicola]|nr:hypothetical protein E2P81_ATG12055 [Venturia nashicola]